MMNRTRIISPVVKTSTPARSWSRSAACVASSVSSRTSSAPSRPASSASRASHTQPGSPWLPTTDVGRRCGGTSGGPQDALEDLAGGTLGELRHELHAGRRLVDRHVIATVADDLLGGGPVALAQHDRRAHHLALDRIAHAVHRHLPHGRMAVERLLHLGRPYLEARDV